MHQDGGGGAPDFVLGVRPDPEFPRLAGEDDGAPGGGVGVEQDGKRQLKDGFDFVRRWIDGETGREKCHDRGDPVSGAGHEIGKAAEDFDAIRVEADFLSGLAQGGLLGAGVGRVNAAAREADLAGMGAQMRRALGKQNARHRPGDNADQNRGRNKPLRQHGYRSKLRRLQKVTQHLRAKIPLSQPSPLTGQGPDV